MKICSVHVQAYCNADRRKHMKGFWRFFRASRGSSSHQRRIDHATNEALRQLGNAPGWKLMYHILKEWNKILLTEQVFASIERWIARFEREGDLYSLTDWRQILTMLQDAQANELDEAWERFILRQDMAKLAVDSLLSVTSNEKLHTVLKVRQTILTSDAAIVELLNEISRAQESYDVLRTTELQRYLRLLLDCRDYSLVIAWKNYISYAYAIV